MHNLRTAQKYTRTSKLDSGRFLLNFPGIKIVKEGKRHEINVCWRSQSAQCVLHSRENTQTRRPLFRIDTNDVTKKGAGNAKCKVHSNYSRHLSLSLYVWRLYPFCFRHHTRFEFLSRSSESCIWNSNVGSYKTYFGSTSFFERKKR